VRKAAQRRPLYSKDFAASARTRAVSGGEKPEVVMLFDPSHGLEMRMLRACSQRPFSEQPESNYSEQ